MVLAVSRLGAAAECRGMKQEPIATSMSERFRREPVHPIEEKQEVLILWNQIWPNALLITKETYDRERA